MPHDFLIARAGHPHAERAREIRRRHPEIARLMGRNPYTALILAALVLLQIGIAAWFGRRDLSYWWLSLIVAYAVGAFANHSLYVIIHEATHNLIFKRPVWNRWAAVLADLPNVVPGAMGFHTYHLMHHAHLGDYDRDTDLATHWEARLVGNSSWRKAAWLALFPLFQIARTFRLSHVNTWTPWMGVNILVVVAFDLVVLLTLGGGALLYLFLSMLCALGLHPLGARWIQEHYTLDPAQETHSYYGPLNALALNMGYHNEHHDFPAIPWNRLPAVRRLAPESYDTLASHRSWTRLLVDFIRRPEYSLYARARRP